MSGPVDILLACLYAFGHLVLLSAISNRWVLRMRDNFAKPALVASHVVFWVAMPVLTLTARGPTTLAEIMSFRPVWGGPLFSAWAWVASVAGVAGLANVALYWYNRDDPPELIDRDTWITGIDRDLLKSTSAKALARWDLSRIEVVNIRLCVPQLPLEFAGYRMAVASDLHHGGDIAEALLDAARREVQAAKPDVVLFPGDFAADESGIDDAIRCAGEICEGFPAYAAFGNHDMWADPERLERGLTEAGIRVLRNDSAYIQRHGEQIRVAGVDDLWSPTRDLDKALDGTGAAEFSILLAHNPDHVIEAAARGVNLVLSGHTHGGHINLPVLGPVIVPSRYGLRFVQGLRKVDNTLLYVSRGLGMHPQIRFGCIPELTIIELTREGLIPAAEHADAELAQRPAEA